MSAGANAVIIAAAVAAAQELIRQEEEEMTPYSEKDLADYALIERQSICSHGHDAVECCV